MVRRKTIDVPTAHLGPPAPLFTVGEFVGYIEAKAGRPGALTAAEIEQLLAELIGEAGADLSPALAGAGPMQFPASPRVLSRYGCLTTGDKWVFARCDGSYTMPAALPVHQNNAQFAFSCSLLDTSTMFGGAGIGTTEFNIAAWLTPANLAAAVSDDIMQLLTLLIHTFTA